MAALGKPTAVMCQFPATASAAESSLFSTALPPPNPNRVASMQTCWDVADEATSTTHHTALMRTPHLSRSLLLPHRGVGGPSDAMSSAISADSTWVSRHGCPVAATCDSWVMTLGQAPHTLHRRMQRMCCCHFATCPSGQAVAQPHVGQQASASWPLAHVGAPGRCSKSCPCNDCCYAHVLMCACPPFLSLSNSGTHGGLRHHRPCCTQAAAERSRWRGS
jgi:hypothetical protein